MTYVPIFILISYPKSYLIPGSKLEHSLFTCNTNMIDRHYFHFLSGSYDIGTTYKFKYKSWRYTNSLNSQLLEAVGKLHNILQTGFLGWDSLILGRHILCHRRELNLSHRHIFGMVLASRRLYPRRTDRDGSIFRQQLENK